MAENNIFDEAVSPASTERTMKMTFSISPQDKIGYLLKRMQSGII